MDDIRGEDTGEYRYSVRASVLQLRVAVCTSCRRARGSPRRVRGLRAVGHELQHCFDVSLHQRLDNLSVAAGLIT